MTDENKTTEAKEIILSADKKTLHYAAKEALRTHHANDFRKHIHAALLREATETYSDPNPPRALALMTRRKIKKRKESVLELLGRKSPDDKV